MKKKGFSLVELLIVLVIVLMLIAVGVPSLRNSRESSKNQRATAFLIEVGSAVRADRITASTDMKGILSSETFSALSGTCSGLQCLPARGLLKSIMWDYDGSDTYNGYKFYVCANRGIQPTTGCQALDPSSGTLGEACVTQRLAVMVSTSSSGRFNNTNCAWITADGRYENNYNMESSI